MERSLEGAAGQGNRSMELIDAAGTGDTAHVASLLRNPLTNPNMTDKHGYTALIIAAQQGHAPVGRCCWPTSA